MSEMALPLEIPADAPLSTVQRAWLNGFLKGLLFSDKEEAAAPAEEFPWHDPVLPLAERMALATDRPIERRMMAAMAQMDCGQCGYLCQSYAEKLASGEEGNLTLCAPGGKETARKLKELMASAPTLMARAAASVVGAAPRNERATVPAAFIHAKRLTGVGSEKDTRHVVFDLAGRGLDYEVGDSFGIRADNCPDLADTIVAALGARAGDEVETPDGVRRSLREALIGSCDIARPADSAIELLADTARTMNDAEGLRALLAGEESAGLQDADLLDLLQAFPSARPTPQQLVGALGRLQPRLYSIASSPKAHEGQVHLTVSVVRFERRGRVRKGVASTFLAERAQSGADVAAYVQKAHNFRLPADPQLPIIMVGPGTGIAPFRAFLEERRAIGAPGRNWLFFGEQRRAHDYLYADEFEAWHREGFLTRLDTAFSRDQAEKVYVQHRMLSHGGALWRWLEDGAHFYVCGDAKRMARDVDSALLEIAATHGGKSPADAKTFLAGLTRAGRYQRDVY